MGYLINLNEFSDNRGSLCVFEKELPFQIKRLFWIYDVKEARGGHRHKKSIQALICMSGSCEVYVQSPIYEETYTLDRPNVALVLQPEDWHTMDQFSTHSTLLVLASEPFDKSDYIYEAYR
jgi:hypothetical protein